MKKILLSLVIVVIAVSACLIMYAVRDNQKDASSPVATLPVRPDPNIIPQEGIIPGCTIRDQTMSTNGILPDVTFHAVVSLDGLTRKGLEGLLAKMYMRARIAAGLHGQNEQANVSVFLYGSEGDAKQGPERSLASYVRLGNNRPDFSINDDLAREYGVSEPKADQLNEAQRRRIFGKLNREKMRMGQSDGSADLFAVLAPEFGLRASELREIMEEGQKAGWQTQHMQQSARDKQGGSN